jgi:1,2-diacylglycerol 3-alpha-glucosyltransferase
MTEQKKINIGLFIDVFYPMVDGVVVVVDQYAKLLSEIANVYVFAPKSRDKTYQDQKVYPIYRSKQIKIPFTDYDLSLPFIDIKFKNALKHAKLDIVHIHSPFTLGQTGIKYAKKHNIPVIASLHSQYQMDFMERTKSKVLADLAIKEIMHVFNQCDELWAVNQKVAEIYTAYGAEKNPKVQHNATDMVLFNNLNELDQLKKSYKIKPEEKVFLYVGRLDAVKNLEFMIDALYKLRLQGFKFKMIFVGSGPFEEDMRKHIKKRGLTSYVIFTGKIMDRIQLSMHYRIADLFLFPSLYDSSSLVQIEASSQKTPTLFLYGAATSSTVTENVNGFFSEHDPDAYATKIIDIFKNTRLYSKVKEQCYKDLYKTWHQVTEEAYKNYLRIIEEKKGKMSLPQSL